MKTRLSPIALLLFSILAWSGEVPPPFSSLPPGQALPKEFRIVTLPKIARNNFSLVADEGKTVLRVDSDNSAGSLDIPLTAPASDAAGGGKAVLEWRWKVNRMLDKADMEDKLDDDHSARVYVFFDVPLESLSFADRSKIKLARLVAGVEVPTAALCYVWDNKYRIGYKTWSPYTHRLRKIVLQSGPAHVGQWMTESRDVYADFRDAFGFDAPAVTSIAVGNDSDNTNERVTTWFGDISFRK
ncbi:MAG: DUF3047 domain-containing protein [Rhodoferax sp.]|uniref:DUF3047 domain-containing protein n=1 Tax=Rhodoferax sp. TaxID=50421 RepID=UPI00185E6D67|nr:DUF3047 domain-containing protein [Rhodoferax sp.]NMM21523.1 DUF3047 domain-containing protein [Rhodoferax sp.]